ncbi:MAG: hypothetical protein ACJAVV_002805 [Alphaproteobacteria bacterium]|jgi:hypothetical protein
MYNTLALERADFSRSLQDLNIAQERSELLCLLSSTSLYC